MFRHYCLRRVNQRQGRLKALMAMGISLAMLLGGEQRALAAGPALSQQSIDRLQGLERELSAGHYQQVVETARSRAASAGSRHSDQWARALYLQLAASAAQRMDQPGRAADLLYQARSIDTAPLTQRLQWLEQEAKLRLKAGQLDQAAALFDRWQGQASLTVDDLWLGARIHARLEQWDDALHWVTLARQGNSMSDSDQLALAASIYQQAGQFEAASDVVEAQLDQDDSDPARWQQAAALYQRIGQPGRAAALWEAGWQRGILTGEKALLTRAELHMAGGTPARAAEMLSQALDKGDLEDSDAHRRLVARAWAQTRDHQKALQAWQVVAERTDDAHDWYILGDLAYGWGIWSQAEQGFAKAREKGADNPGQLLLMEGVAVYEQGHLDQAQQVFRQAERFDDSADQAGQWLALIDNDQRAADRSS
ncbi:tetratricopeptide repeat protein [Kushneria sp. Sum13]|uniref:tetratricopeptide repeat protein n=1 Tax=Kushneria sp. Sum13 TaxID=3459196 RepID=UPI004046792D